MTFLAEELPNTLLKSARQEISAGETGVGEYPN